MLLYTVLFFQNETIFSRGIRVVVVVLCSILFEFPGPLSFFNLPPTMRICAPLPDSRVQI